MNDAKDVFIYDPNWNYITNRPKEEVKVVEAIPVHEEFEVDTTNSYGEFSKLIQNLKKNLKAELKKENPDTDSVVNEFTAEVETLVSEKPEMFANPTSTEPTGPITYPITPIFSGGPIPGVDYSKTSEEESSGPHVGGSGGLVEEGGEF
jgi:hypothetical protein